MALKGVTIVTCWVNILTFWRLMRQNFLYLHSYTFNHLGLGCNACPCMHQVALATS